MQLSPDPGRDMREARVPIFLGCRPAFELHFPDAINENVTDRSL
jgi:hypothetical protein